MQALLLVAEHDGPTMLARIGMMRALHRHKPKAAPAPRRKRTKAYPRRKESSESFSRLEAGQFIKLAQTFNTFLESYSSKLDLNKDVKFAMGENYLYVIRGGLPPTTYDALMGAPSMGHFFNQNIKGSGSDGPYDCRTHRVPTY